MWILEIWIINLVKLYRLLSSGPEYASTELAARGMLKEADHVAEIHSTVKETLVNEVLANLKQWKTENYHKQVVGRTLKETKTIEEEFKKVWETGFFFRQNWWLADLQDGLKVLELLSLRITS